MSGRANGELRWLPVAGGNSLERAVRSDRAAADRLPVLRLAARPGNGQAHLGGASESAFEDSALHGRSAHGSGAAGSALDLDDLACGLMRLGLPAARSRRMIGAAVEALPRGERTEANVLRRAVASI